MPIRQGSRITDHFDAMYQETGQYPTVPQQTLTEAINNIGIENIIAASGQEQKAGRNMSITETDYTTVVDGNKVIVRSHCYLSPIGFLQVWTEATTEDVEPNLLATARFSWNDHSDAGLEIHQELADKLFAILH